jgi:hypothetical protein
VLDVDGRRRQTIRYPAGLPEQAVSGDRLFYGGPTSPWQYQPVPACSTWYAVVFADAGGTPGGVTVTIQQAALHLMDGAAG